MTKAAAVDIVYRGTVLGSKPVRHAGGTLRVTSTDVFDDRAIVRVLFWLEPGTPIDLRPYDAMRDGALARNPDIDREELRSAMECRALSTLVAYHKVTPHHGGRVITSMDGSSYARRSCLGSIHVPLIGVPPRLTLHFGGTTVDLDIPAHLRDADAHG